MKSKYIYIIAIIVVLLVILFVMKKPQAQQSTNTNTNTNTNKKPPSPPVVITSGTGPTVLNTNYNSTTLTIYVINSLTVANTITFNATSGPPQFFGNFTLTENYTNGIGGIGYDGSNYLNFYQTNGLTSSRIAIQAATSCGLKITDSNKNQISYNTNTASVVGNNLIFISGTDTLVIEFTNSFQLSTPSPPNPNPNPAVVQSAIAQVIFIPYVAGSSGLFMLMLTFGTQNPIYSSIEFYSSDTYCTSDLNSCIASPQTCMPTIVSITHTQGSPSYLNFITNTSTNSGFFIPTGVGITVSDSSNGQSYDTSNVTVDAYNVTFITNNNTLVLTFPSLFTA